MLLIVPTIDPAGRLSAGGAERFARGLCLAFNRERVMPLLATYEPTGEVGEELSLAGVKTFRIPKAGKLSLATIQEIRRIIQAERIDAVLSLHHGVNFYNLLATWGRPRVARVIRLGRVGVPLRIQLTEGLLSHQADALICNSQDAADAVRGLYTIPPSRIHVIANGCDTKRFRYVPYEQRQGLRAQLGLPADAFVLYTPNRVHASKGQDVLAAALARIPELLARHNVMWVNTGLVQDRQIERSVRESLSGLAGRFRLLPPVGETEDWIAASDAVVVPSRTESFPNVILEASAVGRPLLTTACGAAAQVGPELGALLVKPGSVSALSQGLTALLQLSEAARAAQGEAASRIVAERYTIEASAAKYAEVLEQAVTRRKAR